MGKEVQGFEDERVINQNNIIISMKFTEEDNERLQSLKEDVADYKKEVENDALELVTARENLRKSEVRWAKAVIALDEFKTEHEI
ncbi:MAG: hypothetical protein KGJ13_11725 [Patescibacteria group bacterium]|nr:hypothetical protein [Patescibacteria group bacterium]